MISIPSHYDYERTVPVPVNLKYKESTLRTHAYISLEKLSKLDLTLISLKIPGLEQTKISLESLDSLKDNDLHTFKGQTVQTPAGYTLEVSNNDLKDAMQALVGPQKGIWVGMTQDTEYTKDGRALETSSSYIIRPDLDETLKRHEAFHAINDKIFQDNTKNSENTQHNLFKDWQTLLYKKPPFSRDPIPLNEETHSVTHPVKDAFLVKLPSSLIGKAPNLKELSETLKKFMKDISEKEAHSNTPKNPYRSGVILSQQTDRTYRFMEEDSRDPYTIISINPLPIGKRIKIMIRDDEETPRVIAHNEYQEKQTPKTQKEQKSL